MATTIRAKHITRHRPHVGTLFGQGVMHAIMLVMAFASVMPFIWMLFASLKGYAELVSSYKLLPIVWTLNNYIEIIQRVGFPVAFKNSTIVALPVTIMTVLTSTAAGFVFAKYRFWGRETFFTIILSTMMVPFTVVVIPLFITIKDIGLVNNLGALVITGLCSTFGIFLMRQSIEPIPNDYIDAARIDGASEIWIFRQVIMPLSMAAMSTLFVFTFLASWDNFMWPSIILKSPDRQTLPLIIAGLRNLYWNRYNLWAAGSMLTVVPVMILFTIAQRQFVRGLTMGGLKG
jgi:multiple sugar transport system permease protein